MKCGVGKCGRCNCGPALRLQGRPRLHARATQAVAQGFLRWSFRFSRSNADCRDPYNPSTNGFHIRVRAPQLRFGIGDSWASGRPFRDMAFGQDRRRSNRRAFIATSLDPPHILDGRRRMRNRLRPFPPRAEYLPNLRVCLTSGRWKVALRHGSNYRVDPHKEPLCRNPHAPGHRRTIRTRFARRRLPGRLVHRLEARRGANSSRGREW